MNGAGETRGSISTQFSYDDPSVSILGFVATSVQTAVCASEAFGTLRLCTEVGIADKKIQGLLWYFGEDFPTVLDMWE